MSAPRRLILGGPGCGKTTRLLQIVEQALASGMSSKRIAFVAFTTAAANEAKSRAATAFNLNPAKDLPYFRTIHSLCFAGLNLTRRDVMSTEDWDALERVTGEQIRGENALSGDWIRGGSNAMSDGERMLALIQMTQILGADEFYTRAQLMADWDITNHRYEHFQQKVAQYKQEHHKFDFTDMLHRYAQSCDPVPVDLAIIDEAQDLTPAQWRVVWRAFREVPQMVFAGDDDQAIYTWAGADVAQFLSLNETAEIEELPMSHRLPKEVWALSRQLSKRITKRYTKHFQPADHGGALEFVSDLQSPPDFGKPGHGTWMILARNRYQLHSAREECEALGIPYQISHQSSIQKAHADAIITWERLRSGKPVTGANYGQMLRWCGMGDLIITQPTYQRGDGQVPATIGVAPWFVGLSGIPARWSGYYRRVLQNGYKLSSPPEVRLDTIHGVKGLEADWVILNTAMSSRTFDSYHLDADAEHRVFYVGVTRARCGLFVLDGTSHRTYPIPQKVRSLA